MRPLTLRIEGLRSFRSEVEIDFGDRDHMAVIGDTGAGKSSILEAMTYALYGKTSFSGQVGELMNDTSNKMRVVLRFRVSGQEWEAVRTLRRDGKGEVGQARAQLQRLTKDGKASEKVEQVRQVNERVEQLIGLDSGAFLRTVVLPQGRFARLLVEDKPTERGRVLRKVWPTDDLEEVGKMASRALTEVQQTRARLQGAADGRPEDPEAHLAELTAIAETAEQRATEASELAQAASQAMSAMREAAKREQSAAMQRARLEPGLAQINEAEAEVAPVAETESRLDKEERALKQTQAGVRDQLKNLPSDDDGPGRKEVADALAKLGSFRELAEAATEAAREMRDKKAKAANRREAADQAKGTAAKAKEEKERHAQLRPPLAEAEAVAKTRRDGAVHAHERCSRLHGAATDAQAKVASLEEERTRRTAEAESANKKRTQLKAVARQASDLRDRARRASSAAAAAHGLHPGDDCPVCQRDLPESWTPPPDEGLAEAEEAAKKAERQSQESEQQATRANTRMEAAEGQLADAQADAQRTSEECRAAIADLVANFGDGAAPTAPDAQASVPPLLPLDPLVDPLNERARQASDALARHEEAHKELADKLTQQSSASATAEAEATGAQKLAEAAREAAVRDLDRLKHNVSETPSSYRPQVGLPADPAELDVIDASEAAGLVAQAKDRERVLAYREEQRQKCQKELDQVSQDLEALVQLRDAQVKQPLAAVGRQLGPHRDAMLRARDALDDTRTATDLPGQPDEGTPAALRQWMQEMRNTTSTLIEVAGNLAKQGAEQVQAARKSLAQLGRQLVAQHTHAQQHPEDNGTDASDAQTEAVVAVPEAPVAPEAPTDPEAVLAAANEARDEHQLRARTAVRDRDDFAAVFDDVQALRALLREAEELELALTDLDKALKPGAFLKWLTLRRSRSLLIHASRMLREISSGKYSFADPGDDEKWSVLDEESGQPRSPASLSGGEQFIASLALALGMVEMMARSGGRLESLFLDEGFGSLDRNNLDAAVEALGTVAAQGRMVGVISHVRAVAEQIDHVLAVTRTAAGSQAEWLSSAQRNRLSLSEVGSEASAAIQGLLE